MENWLELGVAIFLIGMVLYGHYRGFMRLAVSMVALIATLMIVNVAMPKVSGFLKDNTPIFTWIEEAVDMFPGAAAEEEPDNGLPAKQRQMIEDLAIPQEIKDILIENNNNEVYRVLGVDAFTDYIGNYLANIILNLVGFLLLFGLTYLVIHLLMRWLDIMARLPILSGLNKIAGAILGGIQGLFYLWIGFLVVTAFSGTAWAATVTGQIDASSWLTFLSHYNMVSRLVLGIIQGMLT